MVSGQLGTGQLANDPSGIGPGQVGQAALVGERQRRVEDFPPPVCCSTSHGAQAGTAQVVTGMLAAQQAEVLLFGVVVFGLRVADPFLLAAAVISWALALLGIGTALGATLRSQSELNMAYDIGGVVLSALGGALIPLSVLPVWARAAAPASPGYWAMSALRSALQGQAGATLRAAAVLLAVAAGTAALGTWRMTRGWSGSRSL
jgi:ABC-2 type transport system permease protein